MATRLMGCLVGESGYKTKMIRKIGIEYLLHF
jgi:hypothetical protein